MKIGILGGGQLARMLALAGYPLGHEFLVLDPAEDACAGQVAEHIVAGYDDHAALDQLAAECEVVTLDFENVPVAAVEYLEVQLPVRPGSQALRVAQDRLLEKNLFTQLGIPTAPYVAVDDRESLKRAVRELGTPCIIKTRRMGYDGKGQVRVDDPGGIDEAFDTIGGVPLLVEGVVPFRREFSALAVRAPAGHTAVYPLTENRHKNGILVTSFAPANLPELEATAFEYAERLLAHLDYAGLLAIEFFEADGRVIANEMAPRVHNSGHWTIDAAVTSQFENHLRGVTDWPLGSTRAIGAAAMLNWIGAMPDPATALSYPDAHWHDYGKKPRTGRKVGHVTITSDNIITLQTALAQFAMALGAQLKESGVEAFRR